MVKDKYKEGIREEGVGTSNGFWYDLTNGGYISPSEILVNQERAQELNDAIVLLWNWQEELEEDHILKEF